MRVSLFAFSRRGMQTAEQVLSALRDDEIQLYAPERIASGKFLPIPAPAKDLYDEMFSISNAMVFIGAAGIAVRAVAPFVKSKLTDPAVLCIDEFGKFVIPLLSGHIGGANELAKRFSVILNAQAVITTATDINRRFAVDSWAVSHGFLIDDIRKAKEISAAILEQDIPVCSMLPIRGDLPNGLYLSGNGLLGIYIGWEKKQPFVNTLRLIPDNLHLGIGCRKGTDSAVIKQAVAAVLDENCIDPAALKCVASIELKKNEPGLLEFCNEKSLPVVFCSAEELRKIPGKFTRSSFVEKTTGVDNVCERAAMVGADRLIVRKTIINGVTIAVAAEIHEVNFG